MTKKEYSSIYQMLYSSDEEARMLGLALLNSDKDFLKVNNIKSVCIINSVSNDDNIINYRYKSWVYSPILKKDVLCDLAWMPNPIFNNE